MAEPQPSPLSEFFGMPTSESVPKLDQSLRAKDFTIVNPTEAKVAKLDAALSYIQRGATGREVVREMAADNSLKIKISDEHEWSIAKPEDSKRDVVRNSPHWNHFDYKDNAITWMADASFEAYNEEGWRVGEQSSALMLARLGAQATALKGDKTGTPNLDQLVYDELPAYVQRANVVAKELREPRQDVHRGFHIFTEDNPTAHDTTAKRGDLDWMKLGGNNNVADELDRMDQKQSDSVRWQGLDFKSLEDPKKTPVSIKDFAIIGRNVDKHQGESGANQYSNADLLKLDAALCYLQSVPAGKELLVSLVKSNHGEPIPLLLNGGADGVKRPSSDFDGRMLKWSPKVAGTLVETENRTSNPGREGGVQSAALQLIKAAAQATDPQWDLHASIRNLPNGMTGAEVYAENKANQVAAQLIEPQVKLYTQRVKPTGTEEPTARLIVEYRGTDTSPTYTVATTGAKPGPYTMEATQFDLESGKKLNSVKDMLDGKGGHTQLVTSHVRGHEVALTYDMNSAQPQVIEVNKLYGDQKDRTPEQRSFVLKTVQGLNLTPEKQLLGNSGLETLLIPTQEALNKPAPQESPAAPAPQREKVELYLSPYGMGM